MKVEVEVEVEVEVIRDAQVEVEVDVAGEVDSVVQSHGGLYTLHSFRGKFFCLFRPILASLR